MNTLRLISIAFAFGLSGALRAPAADAAPATCATVTVALSGYLTYLTKSLTVSTNGHIIDVAPVTNGTVTLAFPVLAGTYTFTVSGFDAAGGTGHALSTGSSAVTTVPASGSISVPLTVLAIPASISFVFDDAQVVVGKRAVLPLGYVTYDAAGASISGSAPFARPITLATTDPLDARLSVTTLSKPATPFTVTYSGAPVAQIGLLPSVPQKLPKTLIAPSFAQEVYRYDFDGNPTDGAVPDGSLIEDAGGSIYGTTELGGAYCPEPLGKIGGCGSIFKLTRTATGYSERLLHSFSLSDGSGPGSGLLAGAGGRLFGVNANVFELSPSGGGYALTTLYRFTAAANGQVPTGGLIADPSGSLYGTALGGLGVVSPAQGDGVVYKLTPQKSAYAQTVLYRFGAYPADGILPFGNLIRDAGGALYGTTSAGGAYRSGTVFKLTPTAAGYTESILHSFRQGVDGYDPSSGVVAGAGGVLYGTAKGGPANEGVVFALVPAATGYVETTVYAFTGGYDGGDGGPVSPPNPGLALDAAGSLYGTTYYGGGQAQNTPHGNGTVYKIERVPAGYRQIVLHRFDDGINASGGFDGTVDGTEPVGAVLVDPANAVWGVTQYNGFTTACTDFSTYFGGCGSVFKLVQ